MRADERLKKLEARRTDPRVTAARGLNEVYKRLAEDSAVKYAVGAMQPIDPEYTANTIAEGERVRAQLADGLLAESVAVEFRYQGSVTNETHIKAHSDIDLVTIFSGFYTLEPPQPVIRPYAGDPLADLQGLRRSAQRILSTAFPAVTVDASGGKSLALTGGSLRRKIDVVIANWWNTVEFTQLNHETFRGIQILDSAVPTRLKNKPFLHNYRIEERDTAVGGGMRKVTRLLKSLKYDAESPVRISSYDIASVAYCMPDAWLSVASGHDLLLLERTEKWLRHLILDDAARTALRVPNDTRPIFDANGANKSGLVELHGEVEALRVEVVEGLARSFRRLEEARVAY